MATEVVRMLKDAKISRWLFEAGKTYVVDSRMAEHFASTRAKPKKEAWCERGDIPADGAEDRTGECLARWLALRAGEHLTGQTVSVTAA